MLSRRALTSIAAAGIIVASPAVAEGAPTIRADFPCYTPGMTQAITGGGFTPGGPVELAILLGNASVLEYQGSIATTADAAGAIGVQAQTPHFDADRGLGAVVAMDVTLRSQGAPPDQFSYALGFDISQWELNVAAWSSARGRPGRRTKVRARGWVGSASTTLYAHYLRKGKLLKTVRVGRLSGTCGDFRGRMKQFPFRPVKAGSYRVEFDTTRAHPNEDATIFYRRVKVARGHALSASAALADPIARLRNGAEVLEYR